MSGAPDRHRPFWYLRRSRKSAAVEIDEELSFHLEKRIEELRASGLPLALAREEARRQFGDLETTRRYCRRQAADKETRMRLGLVAGEWIQDLRITCRSLLRSPMLALTIIVTVGLGIGATTAMFAVVDAALLRPLPYAAPDELVRIYTDTPPYRFRFSQADYLALDAQQTTLARVAAYTERVAAFSNGEVAEQVRGRLVSWSYFDLLGLTPSLGRGFTPADGKPASPPTVIVSHHFWQQRLGASADAIGKPIRLDGMDYTLTGVMPPAVGPLELNQDFFIAARWDTPQRKGPFFIITLARVAAPARAAAAAELRAINKRIFPLWKSSYQDERATWSMVDLKESLVHDFKPIARLSLIAVGLVWLIACVNASNLLVARVTSRRRELAVRTALGASRPRVIRYLLAESAVLAAGAAAVGIALAALGIGLVQRFGEAFVPRTTEIVLAGRTLWLLIAVTAISIAIFGLVPALHGTGGPVDEGLRSLGRSSTGSARVRRLRQVLVGSQFAVATPLLIVAGLLVGSLDHLRRVDLGFDTRHLLTASIFLPRAEYREAAQQVTFWNELRQRLARLPGVTGVTFVDSRPPEDAGNQNNFTLEASPVRPGQPEPVTTWVAVTPDYFQLLGQKLLQGRLLEDSDDADGAAPVLVVDRAWERRFFPGQSAVGKRLRSGGCSTCPWETVVGVVTGVRYDGLAAAEQGTVYSLMPQRGEGVNSARSRYVMLRTSADPAAVLPAVRRTLRELDPNRPLSRVATVEDLVAQSLEVPRALSLLIGALSVIALVLAVVGIYGVMAHYVQQHAKDISIRLALGGRPGSVLRLIVGRGVALVGGGVAVGIVIAAVLARLLSSVFFGVSALDPATFVGVAALLVGAAALACWIPAARAVAAEPAAVLRND
jgi:putative ABC transport system permease protein